MIRKLIFILALTMMSGMPVVAQSGKTPQIKATYYSTHLNGTKTATGATYRHHLLTAASNMYKLGTRLLVTNIRNGKSVIVLVNDRMAPRMKHRVDLSQSAFKKIANLRTGIVDVAVEVLSDKEQHPET